MIKTVALNIKSELEDVIIKEEPKNENKLEEYSSYGNAYARINELIKLGKNPKLDMKFKPNKIYLVKF